MKGDSVPPFQEFHAWASANSAELARIFKENGKKRRAALEEIKKLVPSQLADQFEEWKQALKNYKQYSEAMSAIIKPGSSKLSESERAHHAQSQSEIEEEETLEINDHASKPAQQTEKAHEDSLPEKPPAIVPAEKPHPPRLDTKPEQSDFISSLLRYVAKERSERMPHFEKTGQMADLERLLSHRTQ